MKAFYNKYRVCMLLVGVFFITSCEEEGDPLTLNDIYEATQEDKAPFKAKINGFNFNADVVAGGKENDYFFMIGVSSNGSSIVVNTSGINPGLYYGLDSSINNVTYKDSQGRMFSSIAPNKKPDAEISIRSYSPVNALASGVFSSTLYSLDSEEELTITNGEFNSLFIQFPFLGSMEAEIDGSYFNADECTFNFVSNGGNIVQTIRASTQNDNHSVTFDFRVGIQEQSYDLSGTDVLARYNSNTSSSDLNTHRFSAISGSLNIVRIDNAGKKIHGNFGFEAVNFKGEKVVIQYGAFQALIK